MRWRWWKYVRRRRRRRDRVGRRWGGRNIREHVAVRSRIHCYVLLLLLFTLCCVMRRNGRIHTYL